MNKQGHIVIIENKQGDRKLFIEIFSELNYRNQIIYFNDVETCCNYLIRHKIKPFLIFSDIVFLNVMNHKVTETQLANTGTIFNCPYLFFTTSFNQTYVIDPYTTPTQSYFVRPYNHDKFKQIIMTIIDYWLAAKPIVGHTRDQAKTGLS